LGVHRDSIKAEISGKVIKIHPVGEYESLLCARVARTFFLRITKVIVYMWTEITVPGKSVIYFDWNNNTFE